MPDGRRSRLGFAGKILAGSLAVGLAGCEGVEWEGVDFAIEQPEPPPRPRTPADTVQPDTVISLPAGPVLFHVRVDREGRARIEPVAEVSDTGLAPLRPRRPDLAARYADRFIERYYAEGGLFTLVRDGARVGTFVVQTVGARASATCPRLLAQGHVELRPTLDTLSEFLAWPAGSRSGSGALELPRARPDAGEFAVILTDRLLRQRGVRDSWRLRLPADLRAVRAGDGGGDGGFAATFLLNDSLAVGPPADSAGMSLLVTDHSPAVGYLVLYFETALYGPGEKRALRWLDRIDLVGDAAPEWILRGYGDASTWYEVVTGTGQGRAVGWSGRDPMCEARSTAAPPVLE